MKAPAPFLHRCVVVCLIVLWVTRLHGGGGYDPCLDTPPDAQGFLMEQNQNPPDPRVGNCTLFQGPFIDEQAQYWVADPIPVDFEVGFAVELRIEVPYSELVLNIFGEPRFGYVVGIADALGRYIYLGFSDHEVGLIGNPFVPLGANLPLDYTMGSYEFSGGTLDALDTTEEHHYYIAVVNGIARLYVDGAFFLTAPVGPEGVMPFTSNIRFGDNTVWANSETELFYLEFTDAVMAERTRGDCNVDGAFDIGDPIFLSGVLYGMQGPEPCTDSCDSNDDGQIDLQDIIYSVFALFGLGSPPPSPFPACGIDPTDDLLGCTEFLACP